MKPSLGKASSWRLALALSLPALLLNPVLITIGFGQVNLFVMLLVMWDLLSERRIGKRQIPLGVATGLAAAVKLTPLLFVPYLLLTRRWRGAVTCMMTFIACEVVTFVVSPTSSRAYWTKAIFRPGRAGDLSIVDNQNLWSVLERFTHAVLPSTVMLPLLVATAAVGLWLAAEAHRRSSPLLGVLIAAATCLFVSPISWVHHMVWVVPAILWLALAPDRPRWGRQIAVVAAVLFWSAPVWWVRKAPAVVAAVGGPHRCGDMPLRVTHFVGPPHGVGRADDPVAGLGRRQAAVGPPNRSRGRRSLLECTRLVGPVQEHVRSPPQPAAADRRELLLLRHGALCGGGGRSRHPTKSRSTRGRGASLAPAGVIADAEGDPERLNCFGLSRDRNQGADELEVSRCVRAFNSSRTGRRPEAEKESARAYAQTLLPDDHVFEPVKSSPPPDVGHRPRHRASLPGHRHEVRLTTVAISDAMSLAGAEALEHLRNESKPNQKRNRTTPGP